MATVKVIVKWKIVELLKGRFPSPSDLKAIGEGVESSVKESIAAGLSPVRGSRRYTGYKDTRKYPGGRKPNRPVNLNLSGEMISKLTFRVKSPHTVEFGLINASDEVLVRARTHNDGTHPHVPERPFIPDKPGQTFTVSILKTIRDIYSTALSAIIEKSNR